MLRIELVKPYGLEFLEADKPALGKNQVLLEVRYVGICGSDLQMYHGLHKYMTYPVVIGHEVSAIIIAVGEGVTGFSPGDKVTVEPQITCGECYPCQTGRFNVCEKLAVLGVHRDGFCQDYAVVDTRYLHKCPADMEDRHIAFVEPLAVGVGSVKRAPEYKGANIVIVGAGTIGNLTAQAATRLGAGNVLLTDISEPKLELARRLGIDRAVNTTDRSLGDVIQEHFGKRKADVIIDCAATKGSILSILKAARQSSSIIVTGNFKAPVEIELPILQRQEISLIGHMMYVREDYADAIQFLHDGSVKVDELTTKVFPAREAAEAFAHIDRDPSEIMKVLLAFGERKCDESSGQV